MRGRGGKRVGWGRRERECKRERREREGEEGIEQGEREEKRKRINMYIY